MVDYDCEVGASLDEVASFVEGVYDRKSFSFNRCISGFQWMCETAAN